MSNSSRKYRRHGYNVETNVERDARIRRMAITGWKWLGWCLFALIGALALAILIAVPMHAQRTTNTFNVYDFRQSAATQTVGDMTAAAQNQCQAALNCIIILDPILNGFAIGNMPSKCANCTWFDYRTPGLAVFNSGAQSVSNAGRFDNVQYNQYLTSAIGGCSLSGLYSSINGGNATDSIAACVTVPNGATQRQNDAIVGIADVSAANASSPGVGVTGMARCNAFNARCFAGNFVANDNSIQTGNLNGVEIDLDDNNASSLGTGLALVRFSGNGPSTQAIQIATGSGNPWPYGIRFPQGATPQADSNTGAAIRFDPVAAGNSQQSQGIEFFGTTSGGGSVMEKIRLLPSGALDVDATGGGGTFSVGGGTPISTTSTLLRSGNGANTNLQTKRVAGCTTAASVGGLCSTDITFTWTNAFADANYTVMCGGDAAITGFPAAPFVVAGSKLAGSIHVNYFAVTAVAASYATVECIAVHD